MTLLDARQSDLPRIVQMAACGKLTRREELAAVDAELQQNLPRPHALHVDREADMRAGHDLRQLGVGTRLDVHQPRVGRAHQIRQKRSPGGIENALGREGGVQAENHDHPGEGIGRAHQSLLIDDGVDLNLGQIADRPRFQRRHDGLRHLALPATQLQIVDQAVLERRVSVLDRFRRVDPVDPAA